MTEAAAAAADFEEDLALAKSLQESDDAEMAKKLAETGSDSDDDAPDLEEAAPALTPEEKEAKACCDPPLALFQSCPSCSVRACHGHERGGQRVVQGSRECRRHR